MRTRRRVSDDGAYRKRITPPSPLRQGSQGEEEQEQYLLRRGTSPSPPGSGSPSPGQTPRKRPPPRPMASSPNLQDRRSNRTDIAESGSNPRFSLLSEATDGDSQMHHRERTPSLSKRESTDSRSSAAPSTEDGLHLIGLMPVVEIVSASPFPTPTEEMAQPKPTLYHLGHGHDPDSSAARPTSPPNRSQRALPSILRPSSPSGQPQRPLGVRRVSPSMLSRSSTNSSGGLQSIPAGETSDSTSPQPSRRHVPKRGASVDLSRSNRSSSAVSLPGLAEDAAVPDGLPATSRNGSPLLGPITLDRSRPSSPAGSNPKSPRIVPAVGVHRRNTTQARGRGDMSPPPLRVQFPPVTKPTTGGHGSQSVPASPYSSNSRPGSPNFGDQSEPDYSRPPASRTTKFADEVDGYSDREARSRESSAGARPPLMKKRGESMSEEGRFGKGGANGPGKGGVFGSPSSNGGLSREASTTSLMKGSETRQLITVREEGKSSVVYVSLVFRIRSICAWTDCSSFSTAPGQLHWEGSVRVGVSLALPDERVDARDQKDPARGAV